MNKVDFEGYDPEVKEACLFFADELSRRMQGGYTGITFMEYLDNARLVMYILDDNLPDVLGRALKFNRQQMYIETLDGARMYFKTYPKGKDKVYDYAGMQFASIGFTKPAWRESSQFTKDFLMSRLRTQCTFSARLTIV